ncbi:hypothetical protein P153DRAFT_355749 [Dothidotthia symphoricarpi CBS 119687]|uniref:Uncharacterized protein n=1 Tax=Dothidotthia symphoricarpi CBS 119687 TaxID=1392245 RepID=A0A6A6AJ63_9PLEO|nr:uncharacterized protein P153DRAFT_355749 [Dothidotthia symphoricarpi CBS 119687]KAF2130947.1 hypothetical protein P153DRAFT_355749 [Dothidotthia symphoricarpi CBS 119687]
MQGLGVCAWRACMATERQTQWHVLAGGRQQFIRSRAWPIGRRSLPPYSQRSGSSHGYLLPTFPSVAPTCSFPSRRASPGQLPTPRPRPAATHTHSMDAAMDTRYARPWTPPSEMDRDDARSDYFSDPFRPSSVSSRVSLRSRRYDSSTESSRAKTREPAPFTPKRAFSDHAPRYPFTPDSSQVLRSHSSTPYTPTSNPFTPDSSQILRTRCSTPLSPIPWHEDHDDADLPYDASPVQTALSACISQFEHLIQTRRPTHDQMEYIVGQFEAMASHLSTSAAESPCPRPFPKHTLSGTFDSPEAARLDDAARVDKEYVAKVGRYVKAVAKYIRDLQQRMEEVKSLNTIQQEVIEELRHQMKFVEQGVKNAVVVDDDPQHEEDAHTIQGEDEEEHADKPADQEDLAYWKDADNEVEKKKEEQEEEKPTMREFSTQTSPPSTPPTRTRKILVMRQKPSFWASFGEALDAFGASLFDH